MNHNSTPGYLIAQIDVKDYPEYIRRYGMPANALLQKYGAEPLVASAAAQIVEGSAGGNWTVVIRFPSLAAADAFYNSAEYQPLKSLRVNALTNSGSILIVGGFDANALPV
ncbi:MAG: DUF1330 domain-containing protein [Nevskia sp.]|nr:DUF1330 domain-containing protein [Nevskia sp.]